jgi:hypothetical protein
MPLNTIGKNVKIIDFQDDSLNGVAQVAFFEFITPTPNSCPLITRVVIGSSANQVQAFAAANLEQPLPQFSGSSLAGNANIVRLALDGSEADRQPRFVFVSQLDSTVNPPAAAQLSLAHDPNGLPVSLNQAYTAGVASCFGKLTTEATGIFERVAELQSQLDNLQPK